jgi:hypothetical protein
MHDWIALLMDCVGTLAKGREINKFEHLDKTKDLTSRKMRKMANLIETGKIGEALLSSSPADNQT